MRARRGDVIARAQPISDNGIKIFGAMASKLPDEQEAEMRPMANDALRACGHRPGSVAAEKLEDPGALRGFAKTTLPTTSF